MNNILSDLYKNESEILKQYSILSGSSGYMLLLYYLKEHDKLYEIVNKTISSLQSEYFSTMYSNGASGLLWALHEINKAEEVDYLDDVINELDDILIETIERQEENSFDFLHDITGIIHYLTEHSKDERSRDFIRKYLLKLESKSFKSEHGLYLKFYQPVQKIDLINFSLSHGMAAVIQVLSRIYKKGIETDLSIKLLDGYVSFILNNKQNVKEIGSYFPNALKERPQKSRLAWCYGDLGTAIALWQAGDNTGNSQWKQEAENILLQTTDRITKEDTSVLDPMICHGSSGLAVVYNRMWRNTGHPAFLEAREYWLKETRKFARFEDGVAGYKFYMPDENKWYTDYGLLEGGIGLALTFLQAESEQDINWDRLLLISS